SLPDTTCGEGFDALQAYSLRSQIPAPARTVSLRVAAPTASGRVCKRLRTGISLRKTAKIPQVSEGRGSLRGSSAEELRKSGSAAAPPARKIPRENAAPGSPDRLKLPGIESHQRHCPPRSSRTT